MNRRGFLSRLIRAAIAAPVLAFCPVPVATLPRRVKAIEPWEELIEATVAEFVRGREEELIESFGRYAAMKGLMSQGSVRFGEGGGEPPGFVVREKRVGGERTL